MKVAFTDNDHKLHFIDFTENPPSLHSLTEVPTCSNLAISPDGKWIAFQTGSQTDGASYVESTAWIVEARDDAVPVRISDTDAGWAPRFLQGAGELTVVWATCGGADTDATYAWEGCGAMLKRTCPDGVPGPVDTLFAGGSYFGGASYDGLFLSSAEYSKNGFIKDVSTSLDDPPVAIHNVTCTVDGRRDTTFTLQVCNPSASQSRHYQNVTMFLDFGFFPEGNGLSACNPDLGAWAFYEMMFIATDEETILKKYSTPSVTATTDTGVPISYEWANSEWSTHPYFGIASEFVTRRWPHPSIPIMESSKKIEHITAIDLKDSSFLRLVSTTDTTKTIIKASFSARFMLMSPMISRKSAGWVTPARRIIFFPSGW
ncbi:MAG: hypothetical protein GF401_00625 [Chitinivibrionales bacterium]|nr:hypothetical protein [Chitinivibrionales bacterium]